MSLPDKSPSGISPGMRSAPRRIVSLVPSETYNLARLGVLDRLVGRTRYCVAPAECESVPVVGGTKDVDVEAVIEREPEVVLANQEENRRKDIESLRRAGLNVRLVFPKTVRDGLQDLVELAAMLELEHPLVERARSVLDEPRRARGQGLRCFVPIWRNPWMTVNDDTYIGDVLRWLGCANVFGDRPSTDGEGRDTRYARVTWEEVQAAQPQMVLLPDEPYRFGPKHVPSFETIGVPSSRIHCVNGRDLCWHGAWALERLWALEAALLSPSRPAAR
ncbi:MAG: helical backbone metal receptor [Myxococcota bacterium]